MVGIGESMIFYAINEPKKAWSERKMQFTSKSVLGDGLPDEEVLYMVVGSNTAGTVSFADAGPNTRSSQGAPARVSARRAPCTVQDIALVV